MAKKTPMREQDPILRGKNFNEVALGYNMEEAKQEAARCLGCKKPKCVAGCPVNVDIPGFIKRIEQDDVEGAYDIIRATNGLPAICGRVCPQETQCEQLCILGIKQEPVAIGRLERFAADSQLGKRPVSKPESNGIRVAVVGAGPAGLTAASDLRQMGYEVTVFEALHAAGGVLIYGIPEFRLPKALVAREIDTLTQMGVDIRCNQVVGRIVTVDDLFESGYRAVFIGSGAGLPTFMNIPGEDLNGVYSANEYLTRVNLMKAYLDEAETPILRAGHVAVVGGGNVAMDAARCALRLGAKVSIVYRRTEAEMPARVEELHHAKEEGIEIFELVSPEAILGDDKGWVSGMRCVRYELGEPDDSGRRRPVKIEGSQFEMSVDQVIMAIGTSPNPLIASTTEGLETNKWGCIVVKGEDDLETMRDHVYAGGDVVTGAATVILAMGAGKTAAKQINDMIKKTEQ